MSETHKLKFVSVPTPPPPPPLPPPKLPQQTVKPNPPASKEIFLEDENYLMKIISSDVNFSKVFHVSNIYLEPQLQDGPKCGLVALSIATSQCEDVVSVEDLFQTALSLGFTKQGEMFSTESLAVLAEKCCGFKTTLIRGGLHKHLCCIIKSLLKKCLVLVPYDADFNHSPCCKEGFKAHWAVITGFFLLEETKREGGQNDDENVIMLESKSAAPCNCADDSDDSDDIHLPLTVSVDRGRILISKRPSSGLKTPGEVKRGKLCLIGRQGKSKHCGLWCFDDMAESNENLVSVSKARSPDSYLLPKGGLVEGLKGQAIILDRPKVS